MVVVVRGGGSGFQMKFLKETDFIVKKKKRQGAYNRPTYKGDPTSEL